MMMVVVATYPPMCFRLGLREILYARISYGVLHGGGGYISSFSLTAWYGGDGGESWYEF